VLTGFGLKVDYKINRLAAQAKNRYVAIWHQASEVLFSADKLILNNF